MSFTGEDTDTIHLSVPEHKLTLVHMVQTFEYLLKLSPVNPNQEHQLDCDETPAVDITYEAPTVSLPDEFKEPFEELIQLRRSSCFKAGILLQNLSREIRRTFKQEEIVKEVVNLEVLEINRAKRASPKWTFQELLDFVQHLLNKLRSLEQWGLFAKGNELVKNIELFLQTPPAQILHSNYFLVYLLEVQQKLTLQDVQRVISDSVLRLQSGYYNIPEADRQFLLDMEHGDPSSSAIETFFYDNHQELSEKFKAFTTEEEPLAYLCDFLVILRVFMQDQTRLTLHIPEDLNEGISIFRSIRAWKVLESKLKSFFYDVIKINQDLPCNEASEIRINSYLFKKLVVYLLRTGALVCKEVESLSPPTSIGGFEGFDNIFAGLQTEIDALPVIDMYIATGATTTAETPQKVADCAYSLQYRLFYFMQEMRMIMETVRLDQERLVCAQVIDSITQHIKNLTVYAQCFDEAQTNLQILGRHKTQMKQLFQIFNQGEWAANVSMLSFPDRFGSFIQKLKGPDLAKNLAMKNFALMCQQQLMNLTGELDLEFFNKIFERACSKIALNESESKMKFQEAMTLLFSRVEKVFPMLATSPPKTSSHLGQSPAQLPNVKVNTRSIRITQNPGQLLVPTSNKGYLPLRNYSTMGESESHFLGASRSHDPSPAPNDNKTVVIGRGIKPRAATDHSQTSIMALGQQLGTNRTSGGTIHSNLSASGSNHFASRSNR